MVSFSCDNLYLEGILALPGGVGRVPGVVLCHPHPLYGGDMFNGVIIQASSALIEHGIATLAFNFRGTGRSGGKHDQGVGEVADALAAVDYLSQQQSVNQNLLGIVGYSFGAGIALDAVETSHSLGAVATVACPLPPLNDMILHQINRPKLFVQGDTDYLIPIDLFRFLIQRFKYPKDIEVLEGADHTISGYEVRVGQLIANFFKRTLAP